MGVNYKNTASSISQGGGALVNMATTDGVSWVTAPTWNGRTRQRRSGPGEGEPQLHVLPSDTCRQCFYSPAYTSQGETA